MDSLDAQDMQKIWNTTAGYLRQSGCADGDIQQRVQQVLWDVAAFHGGNDNFPSPR